MKDSLSGVAGQIGLDSAGASQSSGLAPRYSSVISLLAMVSATGFLYRPLLVDWFASLPDDPTFSYALWIPPVAIYLVYLQVKRIGVAALASHFARSYGGYAIIAIGCALLLAGEVSTLLYLARFSFLVVLAGITLTMIGWKGLCRFAFPAGYLLFAVPLPALIYIPMSARLQMLSSFLAGDALDLLAVPALREGNIITLPNNQLEVIEACSGIHSLFALLAIATLAGYLLRDRNIQRLWVALSAIPVAILLNAARITVLAILSYYVRPAAAAGFAHMTTGLVIFLIGCAVIIALCARKRKIPGRSSQGDRPPMVNKLRSGNTRPTSRQSVFRSHPTAQTWLNVVAAVGLLALAAVVRGKVSFDRPIALRQDLSVFPLKLGSWTGHDVTIPPTELAVLRATGVLMREYSGASDPPIDLYVAYFGAQREGTAMHSPLHCIPGAGWEVARQSVLSISSRAMGIIPANKVIFTNGDSRMLVVYWYMEQGRTERGELQGAMATLWHAFFEHRSDGCLIRLSGPIVGSEQTTLNELLKFVNQSAPLLMSHFLPA